MSDIPPGELVIAIVKDGEKYSICARGEENGMDNAQMVECLALPAAAMIRVASGDDMNRRYELVYQAKSLFGQALDRQIKQMEGK